MDDQRATTSLVQPSAPERGPTPADVALVDQARQELCEDRRSEGRLWWLLGAAVAVATLVVALRYGWMW